MGKAVGLRKEKAGSQEWGTHQGFRLAGAQVTYLPQQGALFKGKKEKDKFSRGSASVPHTQNLATKRLRLSKGHLKFKVTP